MTAKKGLLSQFPRSFWAANTMEIFERMGWYGFYAVSSLYLTGSVEDGGLGFSSADRGVIQGLATFSDIRVEPRQTGRRIADDHGAVIEPPVPTNDSQKKLRNERINKTNIRSGPGAPQLIGLL